MSARDDAGGGRQAEDRMGMNQQTKIYIVPEKNFLRQVSRGMWIGSTFKDHGKTMKVVAVGEVRQEGKEKLIDITAVENNQ